MSLAGMRRKGIVIAPSATGHRGAGADGPLQAVANQPIVCHVVQALRDADISEIAVVAASDTTEELSVCIERQRPADVNVRFLPMSPGYGVYDAVLRAADFVGEAPCIVHLADGLLSDRLATCVAHVDQDTPDLLMLVCSANGVFERLGATTRRLLRIEEINPARFALAAAGVCVLGPGAMRAAAIDQREPAAELGFTALAERIAGSGGRVCAQLALGWRRYTGSGSELLEMNRELLDALESDGCLMDDSSNRIEGRVVIHPTATVTSSVVLGPAIIGAGARVSDAYIGPYTSIGDGVRIEGSEIERSIILAGASVLFVGRRLESSVVGRDARIFRDYSLPRALRLVVGDHVEVALC